MLRRPRGKALLDIYKGKVNQLWYTPVVIRPHQQPHFDRIDTILDKGKGKSAVDVTRMGGGKTWMANATAQKRDLVPLVIAVSAGCTVWTNCFLSTNTVVYKNSENHNENYIISYESLRGRKDYNLKHGLLVREETESGPVFKPTNKLKEYVAKGTLFIFDECQKFKNDCEISEAIKAIFDEVVNSDSRSRIMMLSGSMADRADNIINIMRVMRIIKHPNLYTRTGGTLLLEGIDEMFEYGDTLNKPATDAFIARNPIDEDNFQPEDARRYVLNFWKEVIQDEICSCMPPDPNKHLQAKQYCFNLICPLAADDYAKLSKAVNKLSKALRGPEEGRRRSKNEIGAITNCLIEIQEAKVPAMECQARNFLEARFLDKVGRYISPKVALLVDYARVWEELKYRLADYNPLLLTGETKNVKEIVDNFNSDDDTHRLLIASSEVGCLSLNLDDKTGHRSRIGIMMPGYKAVTTYQGAGRFDRSDTLGVSMFFLLYGYSPTELASSPEGTGSDLSKTATPSVPVGTTVPTVPVGAAKAATNTNRRMGSRRRKEEEENKPSHGIAETRIFNALHKKGLFIKSIHGRPHASSSSSTPSVAPATGRPDGQGRQDSQDGSVADTEVRDTEIIEEDAEEMPPDAVFPGEYEDIVVTDELVLAFLPKEWEAAIDPETGYYMHLSDAEQAEWRLQLANKLASASTTTVAAEAATAEACTGADSAADSASVAVA